MSLSRALLRGSPAKVTFNGGTFYSRDDFFTPMEPQWGEVPNSMHGLCDHAVVDNRFVIRMRLWGAWENLSTLFPSTIIGASAVGGRLSGLSATDKPLVVHGRNQDRINYTHAFLTKMPDLYLGIDAEIFAADVEFTAVVGNGLQPEASGSLYTMDTAAFTDSLVKTNYKQQRYDAVWGTQGGFTAFQFMKGINVMWEPKLSPHFSANVGTVDFDVEDVIIKVKGIPLEPTNAQMLAPTGVNTGLLGRLRSAGTTDSSKDMAITGSGVALTLYKMAMLQQQFAWGAKPLRNGEVVWQNFATDNSARALVA